MCVPCWEHDHVGSMTYQQGAAIGFTGIWSRRRISKIRRHRCNHRNLNHWQMVLVLFPMMVASKFAVCLYYFCFWTTSLNSVESLPVDHGIARQAGKMDLKPWNRDFTDEKRNNQQLWRIGMLTSTTRFSSPWWGIISTQTGFRTSYIHAMWGTTTMFLWSVELHWTNMNHHGKICREQTLALVVKTIPSCGLLRRSSVWTQGPCRLINSPFTSW